VQAAPSSKLPAALHRDCSKREKNSEELETGCIGAGFSCAVRAMRVGYLGRGLSGMTPNQKALKGPAAKSDS
jgi:hypothetical protein